MDKATRAKLLQAATAKLKKQFGEDVIIDAEKAINYEVISTGSLLLDTATDIGGLPRGRLVEIAGPSGSGKSTLCSTTIAEAQIKYPDLMVLYLDLEHATDISYMQSLGVDTSSDRFLLVQPNTIEEAFEIADTYASTGLFSIIVLDSVGNSTTKTILEKGYDEATMGSLAKACATGLTKLVPIIKSSNTLLVLVNTEYAKMSYTGGNETKGGASVKYLTSMRIRLTKRDLIESENNKEEIAGQVLTFKFVKNKCGQPYRSGETTLYFYKGFDKQAEIVDIAISKGIIERGGAWYNFQVPEKKGSKTMVPIKLQGKAAVVDYFRNDEDAFEYLKTSIDAKDVIKIDESIKEEE